MILTGSKIRQEVNKGNIVIYPFSVDQINPNSYNYRLGNVIKVFEHFDGNNSYFKKVKIPKKGFVLFPGKMYLANTAEIIGSKKYAMSLIGKSSMGRHGLFLQQSANLGHTTSQHHWTLEIFPILPIRVYPNMIIGQVTFWMNQGKIEKYIGAYGQFNTPKESFVINLLPEYIKLKNNVK